MNDTDRIKQTVSGITAAWRQGRIDALSRFYRPDVVFVQPGFGGRVEGREACVESYRDFLTAATVHDYAEDAPRVDVFGDTAIAVTHFEIDYQLEDKRHRETGHDMLVLVREEGEWRVAWRTLLPSAPSS